MSSNSYLFWHLILSHVQQENGAFHNIYILRKLNFSCTEPKNYLEEIAPENFVRKEVFLRRWKRLAPHFIRANAVGILGSQTHKNGFNMFKDESVYNIMKSKVLPPPSDHKFSFSWALDRTIENRVGRSLYV